MLLGFINQSWCVPGVESFGFPLTTPSAVPEIQGMLLQE